MNLELTPGQQEAVLAKARELQSRLRPIGELIGAALARLAAERSQRSQQTAAEQKDRQSHRLK